MTTSIETAFGEHFFESGNIPALGEAITLDALTCEFARISADDPADYEAAAALGEVTWEIDGVTLDTPPVYADEKTILPSGDPEVWGTDEWGGDVIEDTGLTWRITWYGARVYLSPDAYRAAVAYANERERADLEQRATYAEIEAEAFTQNIMMESADDSITTELYDRIWANARYWRGKLDAFVAATEQEASR